MKQFKSNIDLSKLKQNLSLQSEKIELLQKLDDEKLKQKFMNEFIPHLKP